MPIPRVVSTHSFCIICRIEVNLLKGGVTFSKKKMIFIPNGDRCCNEHMIDYRIYEDDLSYLCINSNTSKISKSELLNFLN